MATPSKIKATATKKTSARAATSKSAKSTIKAISAQQSSTRKAGAPKASAKSAIPKNGKSKIQSASKRRIQNDNIVTHDMIADQAYNLWTQNGFAPGMEMQNWLQAEQELCVRL